MGQGGDGTRRCGDTDVRGRGLALGVDLLGDLQSVRVGEVGVGRRDGQKEAVVFGDELKEHLFDLILDVGRLIPNRDLCHPGKIHQGEVQY